MPERTWTIEELFDHAERVAHDERSLGMLRHFLATLQTKDTEDRPLLREVLGGDLLNADDQVTCFGEEI